MACAWRFKVYAESRPALRAGNLFWLLTKLLPCTARVVQWLLECWRQWVATT